jgi:hypothetical protein
MVGEKGRAHVCGLHILESLRSIPEVASGKAMLMQGGVILPVDVRAAVIEPHEGLLGVHRKLFLCSGAQLRKGCIPRRV